MRAFVTGGTGFIGAIILGKLPSIPLDGVKMSKQSMYYDSSKAVQELGLPQSPIRQALADAINWFQTNGDITY